MSPLLLFRRVAVAEAVTWALLLVGMVLKYVTGTTEQFGLLLMLLQPTGHFTIRATVRQHPH